MKVIRKYPSQLSFLYTLLGKQTNAPTTRHSPGVKELNQRRFMFTPCDSSSLCEGHLNVLRACRVML